MSKEKNRKPGLCLFPNYRWCGPGCSGPGNPINDVDNCCKAHDLCLQKSGSRCACDKKFLVCLRSKINLSDKGIVAGIMYTFMKFQLRASCGTKGKKTG